MEKYVVFRETLTEFLDEWYRTFGSKYVSCNDLLPIAKRRLEGDIVSVSDVGFVSRLSRLLNLYKGIEWDGKTMMSYGRGIAQNGRLSSNTFRIRPMAELSAGESRRFDIFSELNRQRISEMPRETNVKHHT